MLNLTQSQKQKNKKNKIDSMESVIRLNIAENASQNMLVSLEMCKKIWSHFSECPIEEYFKTMLS